MSELNIEYPNIVEMVSKKHAEFIERFGKTIAMLEGDSIISANRIRARLELLVGAFIQTGVIDGVSYGTVSSKHGVFPMSLSLNRNACSISLYLLNTGKDVIVSDSIGLAQTIDALESRIVLVTGSNRVGKRFTGALDIDFNWSEMAEFVLEAIHKVMYDSDEAKRIKLLENFTN